MKVFLSSIAKNDIRMLMRVFNADQESKGLDFLQDLRESVDKNLENTQQSEIIYKKLRFIKMQNFPVHIHYLFENEGSLLITAIFKEI